MVWHWSHEHLRRRTDLSVCAFRGDVMEVLLTNYRAKAFMASRFFKFLVCSCPMGSIAYLLTSRHCHVLRFGSADS